MAAPAADRSVVVLFATFSRPLDEPRWDHYFHQVPTSVRERVLRYRRWQDRHLGLFGKLLLRDGLRRLGYPDEAIETLRDGEFGKPTLDCKVDFSISHSGTCAVCALASGMALGIDIEEVRDIELEEFREFMPASEWQRIIHSRSPQEEFFRSWTRCESVIKADGRGLSAPLLKIETGTEKALLDDKRWYLKEVSLTPGYYCHLATDIANPILDLQRVEFM